MDIKTRQPLQVVIPMVIVHLTFLQGTKYRKLIPCREAPLYAFSCVCMLVCRHWKYRDVPELCFPGNDADDTVCPVVYVIPCHVDSNLHTCLKTNK